MKVALKMATGLGAKLWRRPADSASDVLGVWIMRLSLSDQLRRGIGIGFLALAAAAVIAYIAAVNAMLYSGEVIKRETERLLVLEREYAALQNIVNERQSPSWIHTKALANGMVEASDIRYLTDERAIAFLPR